MNTLSCTHATRRGCVLLVASLLTMAAMSGSAAELSERNDATSCQQVEASACIGSGQYFEGVTQRKSGVPMAVSDTGQPVIGLALAGGGTRASQFSIGVMKGLFEAGLLEEVRYLSTVSGGGYAGYWYMAQRIYGADPVDMFRDCVPYRYAKVASGVLDRSLEHCRAEDVARGELCLCPDTPVGVADDGSKRQNFSNVLSDGSGGFSDPFRYQNTLRGHTDLFVPSFSYADARSDKRLFPSIVPAVVTQLLTASTIDLFGDVLFDWNINASPSRALYRDGIRRIYGMPPVDCAAFLSAKLAARDSNGFSTCVIERPLADEIPDAHRPAPIMFSDLRATREGSTRLPYWIINATTPVLNCPKVDGRDACVIREVFGDAAYPPHKAAFEFTPDYWGAGEFGYWRVTDDVLPFGDGILSVDEAVAASAAFFDPRQRSFMLGGLVNGLLQLTGFRWGNYVRNPHVSAGLRHEHRMIPLLYVFHHWVESKDAVDVHLIDGGQSDNLGAYGLIRRRVPNIIISDHAGESEPGNMEDICRLRSSLTLPEFKRENGDRAWYLYFDDLEDLDKVCTVTVDPQELHPTVPQVDQRYRYNLHAWSQPVIRGCAVEMSDDEVKDAAAKKHCAEFRPNERSARPLRYLNLFLIKPAIDLSHYWRAKSGDRLATPQTANAARSDLEINGFLRANVGARDGLGILIFPNHSTVNLTLDSSPWLYGAYRELGAQAARHLRAGQGELVVVGSEGRPALKPKLSYLINRESQELTEKLRDTFARESGH